MRRSVSGRSRLQPGCRRRLALAGFALAFALPHSALAQRSGDGFLFREPRVTWGVRGGFGRASAGSDVFNFSTEQLTLKRDDFSGISLGTDVSVRLNSRFDLVLGVIYTGSRTRSEFRDWVDQNDQPIEQVTTFRRVPLTASLKAYLTPRGRSIGRYAWLPGRVAPFVGVGGGVMWYRFRQRGDFVDWKTHDVFYDDFDSHGWTGTAHAMVGADFSLGPRLVLTTEGRYSWARSNLGRDFAGFGPIDLSGFWATVGVAYRY